MSSSYITIDGRFFRLNDERFIIKGLVYQPKLVRSESGGGQPDDPLRDDRMLEFRRDLQLFKELQINTLFIYNVYLDHEHEQCVKLLSDAGIYVVVLLSDNKHCIRRNDPQGSYTPELAAIYAQKVDMLAKYHNVIGVCIANNLMTSHASDQIPSVLHSAVRDLKIHMKRREAELNQRPLPICINDGDQTSVNAANFDAMLSPEDPNILIDFYMLTNYAPAQTSAESKWVQLPITYAHSNIPMVISEYGSNVVMPRVFDEIDILYSETFLNVFSGGCVYDFLMKVNNYGLVKESEAGYLVRLPDFYTYKEKLRALEI